MGDHCFVDCAQRKEALSAWLDGEESDTERDAIDAHLTICAACRRFADKAAHVTRLARTVVAAHEPDVIEVVLPAARPSRRAPARRDSRRPRNRISVDPPDGIRPGVA